MGKSGFVNKKGKIVIKPRFDSARGFSEGLARVKVNGKIGFIKITTIEMAPEASFN